MTEPRQTSSPWRPFRPPSPQAPWGGDGRPPGMPNAPARGPPSAPGMSVPVATQPRGYLPPGGRMPRPPSFRPEGLPGRPVQTVPVGINPSARAPTPPPPGSYGQPLPSGRPLHAPGSVGAPPGVRPSGHVQPLMRPPSATSFPPRPFPSPAPGHASFPPPAPLRAHGAVHEVLDEFASLTLVPAAPGVQDDVVDAASLPRPAGLIPGPSIQISPQNAHHSFLRMTTGYAPRSGSLRERFHFPYGAIIQPLAQTAETPEVPVVKLESHGILRCRRCRTYINPFVWWTDGGHRWKCNICNALNDIPREYFCTLNQDGTRRDAASRPELTSGSVEYVAPPEYMVRPPMPAVYLFVVDVSAAQTSAEVVSTLSAAIRAALDKLQGDARKKIGFLTFDRTLHFYNLKASDSAKMLVVPEIDDPFLPQPDDLLVNLEEARGKVESFLESWPINFSSSDSVNKQSALGAALQVSLPPDLALSQSTAQAAFLILNTTGGKLELFLSSPPSLGTAAVRNRDNAALYNTDREPALRNPEDSFFKRFTAECSRTHICIDVYNFCGQYTDLASITCLARYTGGQFYRYPGFIPKRDGGRLHHDIVRNLTRYTAWEGVMRIRCSKGLKISAFLGNFFIRASDLLAFPTTDPDKSLAVEIKHDEVVLEGDTACLQCALLYTASCGERRIRVHTLQFPVSHELADLYRGADAAAITTLIAKSEIDRAFQSRISTVQKMIEGSIISGFREYRILHSRHFRGPNCLIFPQALKWLPLWILALLKSTAIRGPGPEVSTDDRTAASFEIMSATLQRTLHILCPTLYNITDIEQQPKSKEVTLPPVVPSSYEALQQDAVYLLDSSQLIFLLFGSAVPLEYLSKLTGIAPQLLRTQRLHTLRVEPAQQNALSQKVCALLQDIRGRRGGYQPVILLQLGTEQEQHLWPFLIEDRKHSMRSYMDFIQMLHRQIGGK